MVAKMFTVGALATNCYVVSCVETREAIIIDPGFDDQLEAEHIIRYVKENKLELKSIVNTHGHPDHTCGNGFMKREFSIPVMIHKDDADMIGEKGRVISEFFGFRNASPPADKLLADEEIVRFGKTTLKVMHTPGHSRGSISLLGKNEVVTGDTLFAGSIGRTDFPESSETDMQLSLQKLAKLPNHLVVYPGHGPTTTMEEEKISNPFLQQ